MFSLILTDDNIVRIIWELKQKMKREVLKSFYRIVYGHKPFCIIKIQVYQGCTSIGRHCFLIRFQVPYIQYGVTFGPLLPITLSALAWLSFSSFHWKQCSCSCPNSRNSSESGERSVLTQGSLCPPPYEGHTACEADLIKLNNEI